MIEGLDQQNPDEALLEQSQQVAKFLEEQNIAIIPEALGSLEILSLVPNAGAGVEIAAVRYDTSSQLLLPTPTEEIRKQHELPGLRTIMRPLGRIFSYTKGDFYNPLFDPIHAALDRIEKA